MTEDNPKSSDKKNNEFTKYDAFSCEHRPTREDMEALSENLKAMLEKSQEASGKKKMSYSISALSQLMIKNASEQYGVTQSSVIELAPFLFSLIAEKSLERRKTGLSTLRLLTKQINASLTAFCETAPHLSAYVHHIRLILEEILGIEEKAVNENNYLGADVSTSEILSRIGNVKPEPAYYLEVKKMVQDFKEIDTQFQYFNSNKGG